MKERTTPELPSAEELKGDIERVRYKKRYRSVFMNTVYLLLGVAAAAVLLTVYNYWDANRAQNASQAVTESLTEKIAVRSELEYESALPDTEESDAPFEADFTDQPLREMPAVEMDGYKYIGALYVPSLQLELPVMEEWDYDRLKIAPCRYYGSAYLDNMVIVAHNYPAHFSSLKWVPDGTEIIFTDMDGNEFHYDVSSVETLQPEQTEDMINSGYALTLFTCNTGGQTRCTIRCDRTE